ncbi:GntR family transcriptional regulator [Sabulicella rubraurantiaca]|uniref:GntR family transcriptional regulator n=1 Tax=Sabulicella rubraurantiaca TaxID=2811429 RepID=UPI001A96B21A|nr:GntR family transcriptional regulator [Sabulicella rubraurantiaca]
MSVQNIRKIGLADEAYGRIREAIVEGRYAAGDPLFENRLSAELGMSRTPIREALQVLARDGLLEVVPARGYFVPRRSLDDLRELFELREALDGAAARACALRAQPDEVEALRALCDRYDAAPDWTEWARTGTEFHAAIARTARNTRLAEALDRLKLQIMLTRRAELRGVEGRHREAAREHRAILAAISAADPDAAEREARLHVRLSQQASLRQAEGWR